MGQPQPSRRGRAKSSPSTSPAVGIWILEAQHPFALRCVQPYTKNDGASEQGSPGPTASPSLAPTLETPHAQAPHKLAPTAPSPTVSSPATLQQAAVAKPTANARMQGRSLSWAGGSQIHNSFKGRGNQSFLPGGPHRCKSVRANAAISAARQAIVCPQGLG